MLLVFMCGIYVDLMFYLYMRMIGFEILSNIHDELVTIDYHWLPIGIEDFYA